MASGPSKQELESYWQNSRQYFDMLADHYRQTDPEYYSEFIKPFYNNSFISSSSGSASGSGGNNTGKARLILFAAMTLMIGLGAAVFLLLSTSEPDNKKIERMEKVAPDTDENRISTGDKEKTRLDTNIYFKRGMDFYRQEKYVLAERFLKKVPEPDKHYSEAREKLKLIYETDEYKNRNERDIRNKPIERVR